MFEVLCWGVRILSEKKNDKKLGVGAVKQSLALLMRNNQRRLSISDVQGLAQSPEARAAKPQKPDPSQALEQAW